MLIYLIQFVLLFVQKGSKPSLITGGVAGGSLIATGVYSFHNELVGYGAGASTPPPSSVHRR